MAKKKTARTNFEAWLQNPRRPYFESGMVGNSRSLGMGAVYALVFVALFYGVFSLALKSTGIKIKADPVPAEVAVVYMPKASGKASGVVLHINSGIPSLPAGCSRPGYAINERAFSFDCCACPRLLPLHCWHTRRYSRRRGGSLP